MSSFLSNIQALSEDELHQLEKNTTFIRRIIWGILLIVVVGIVYTVYQIPDSAPIQSVLILTLIVSNVANVLIGRRQLLIRSEIANRKTHG